VPGAVAAFDTRAEALLEPLRTPALDAVFYPLSSAADHSLLWFILGTAKALRSGDTALALRFGAAMGLESALTNGPVKAMFRRSRPAPELQADEAADPLPYGLHRPVTSSFPSGHATAAFAAAMLLADRGRRGRWLTLATLVAASRVYVRMHHASDAVGGALLGAALGRALRPWVRGR
jgi:undecaprenyl-diphosphatase